MDDEDFDDALSMAERDLNTSMERDTERVIEDLKSSASQSVSTSGMWELVRSFELTNFCNP